MLQSTVLSFDVIFGIKVFSDSNYLIQDVELPQDILNHVKKETDYNNINTIDREQQSARTIIDISD